MAAGPPQLQHTTHAPARATGLYVILDDKALRGSASAPAQLAPRRRRRRSNSTGARQGDASPGVLFRSWSALKETCGEDAGILGDPDFIPACQELLAATRVCDSTTLRDTLTLESKLILETGRLLTLCRHASLGQFLTHAPPAQDLHVSILGSMPWLGDVGAFALATAVVARLDNCLQAAFASAAKTPPPRAPAAAHTHTPPCVPDASATAAVRHAVAGIALRSKTHLADYWDKLPLKERRRLLSGKDSSGLLGAGSRRRHGRHRARVMQVATALPTPHEAEGNETDGEGSGDVPAPPPTPTALPARAPSGASAPPGSQGAATASVCHSSNLSGVGGWEAPGGDMGDGASEDGASVHSHAEPGLRAALRTCSGSEVVTRLFLCPLTLVESPEDRECRVLGHLLQSWWAEKHAMDLIIAEGAAGATGNGKAKRKKQRRGRRHTAGNLVPLRQAPPPAVAAPGPGDAGTASSSSEEDVEAGGHASVPSPTAVPAAQGPMVVAAPSQPDDGEGGWATVPPSGRHTPSAPASPSHASAPPATPACVSVGTNTEGGPVNTRTFQFNIGPTGAAGQALAATPLSSRASSVASTEFPPTPPAGPDGPAPPPLPTAQGGPSPFLPLAATVSPDTGAPLWLEARLHMELLEFQQWCIEEAQARRDAELLLVWHVTRKVQECIPSSVVDLFGSFVTGLAIPSSDVDVRVSAPAHLHPMTNPTFTQQFHALTAALRRERFITSIQAVPTAQVPVIKLVADPERVAEAGGSTSPRKGQEVGSATPPSTATATSPDEAVQRSICMDITFNTPAHRGRRTTDLAGKLLNTNPPLAPLVLLLKQLTAGQGLNDAFTGGVSSYCTLLMVQCFLQTRMQHLVWCTPAAPPLPLYTGPIAHRGSAYSHTALQQLRPVPLDRLGVVRTTALLHGQGNDTPGLWAAQRPSAPSPAPPAAASSTSTPPRPHAVPVGGRERSSSWGDTLGDAMPHKASLSKVAAVQPHYGASGGTAAPQFIPYPHPGPAPVPSGSSGTGGAAAPSGKGAGVEASIQTLPPSQPLLGRLALMLLQFLGAHLEPRTMGLHVRWGKLVPIAQSMDPVWVPDPYDTSDNTNVGRNAFRFPQVQALLRHAVHTLCSCEQRELPELGQWMQGLPAVRAQLHAWRVAVRGDKRAPLATGPAPPQAEEEQEMNVPATRSEYMRLIAARFPLLHRVLRFDVGQWADAPATAGH